MIFKNVILYAGDKMLRKNISKLLEQHRFAWCRTIHRVNMNQQYYDRNGFIKVYVNYHNKAD